MGTWEERYRAAARWCVVCLGAVLLALPAFGQTAAEPPALVPRVAGPVIQAVALEGHRVGSGQLQSIHVAHMNRQGEIAFGATLVQNGQPREGVFTWSGGAVTPLALEGQETGHGPLVLTDPTLGFREWVWGNGSQALFLGAADANRNGVFDPGVDPQFLFLAERGRLTPLLRIGGPLDGGTLLSVLSFRVNSRGQVAFQARIDRNGDGQYTAGVDRAGLYLLDRGRVQPLVRDGEVVGDSVVRGLDLDVVSLEWQFNDRAEVLAEVELDPPPAGSEGVLGLILVDPAGSRLVAREGLQTPFGTFFSTLDGSLNDRGDVIFSADALPVPPEQDAVWRVYRIRSADEPGSQLEVLAQPGDLGPDRSALGVLGGPPTALAGDGSVAFCATYPQQILLPDHAFSDALACFVQTPGDRYELLRMGDGSPWGVIGGIDRLALNDNTQAAVEIRAAMYPFDPVNGPGAGPEAILFWENGQQIGVVGPGDVIPGGQVDSATTHLDGLSNNGRLAFETTVTDDQGVSRNGIFVALVPGQG